MLAAPRHRRLAHNADGSHRWVVRDPLAIRKSLRLTRSLSVVRARARLAERKSTNAKMQEMIDGAMRDELEPDAASLKTEARHLRRRHLYGVGTGGSLPRIRSVPLDDPSHTTAKTKLRETLGDNGTVISYASVPSDERDAYEHDALYRATPWSVTSLSAERVFTGSAEKRHRAAIGAASREPWYVGYVNSASKRSGSEVASACRYGYRGAYNQKLWHTSAITSPERTHRVGDPAFLAQSTLANEWTPALTGAPPYPGGPGLSSPSSWPENAAYVSGFRAKHSGQRPQSAWYQTQTTVTHHADRPLHSVRASRATREARESVEASISRKLRHVQRIEGDEVNHLVRAAANERSTIASKLSSRARPRHPRSYKEAKLQSSGASVLSTLESSSIGGAYALPVADDARGDAASSGPPQNMRYSGPNTVLVCTEAPEANAVMQSATFRFDFRWQEVARLYKQIKSDASAGATPAKVIVELADTFLEASLANNDPGRVRRAQFLDVFEMKLVNYGRGRANVLFNVFDTNQEDALEYVLVIAALMMLCFPEATADEKLELLWVLYERHCFTKSTVARVEAILLTCAQSQMDHDDVIEELKDMFRPAFYRATVLGSGPPDDDPFSTAEQQEVLEAHARRDSQFNQKDAFAHKPTKKAGKGAKPGADEEEGEMTAEMLASTSTVALVKKWRAQMALESKAEAEGRMDLNVSRMLARKIHAEGIFGSSPATFQQFKAALDVCPSTVTLFQNQLEDCMTWLPGRAAPSARTTASLSPAEKAEQEEALLQHRRGLQSKLRQMKEAQERRVANIRQPSRQGSRPTTSQKKGAGASGSTVKSASTSLY